MPSGRLGRCIIPSRTGVELYANSSGSEASVTIQTQVISTTANVEQTVVVGVAATTLRETETISAAPVGTYTSIAGLNYGCWQGATGVSTFNGAFRTPTGCTATTGNWVEGTYCETGASHYIYIDPNSGNQTKACFKACICGVKEHEGNNFRCDFRGMYGGNELQNPLIWLMQQGPADHPAGQYGFPRDCSCCNWFWGNMVIGWNPGQKYETRCPANVACKMGNDDFFLRAPQVIGCTGSGSCQGVGVFKTDIAITTMQMYINPCCCCGYTAANTWPVAIGDGSGCTGNQACCGGPPCNYAFSKYKQYLCCHCNQYCCGYTIGFNWYTLCNQIWCCCRITSGRSTPWTCQCTNYDGSNNGPTIVSRGYVGNALNCCYPCVPCGSIVNDQMLKIVWCGNCWCCCHGYIHTGWMGTCEYDCSSQCGVMMFRTEGTYPLCNCCCVTGGWCWWSLFDYKYKCPCGCYYNRSYRARGGGDNKNYVMSPYGFDHGITNCYWAHHRDGNSNNRHRYVVGWPHPYISGGSCVGRCGCGCYTGKNMYLYICGPDDYAQQGNEYPIKYVAWNPHDCYVYMAVRSVDPSSCGIFRIDADKQRKFHGPHCGCSGNDNYCESCSFTASFYLCQWDGDDFKNAKLDYCKIADWPTCWTCFAYSKDSFCVSCLFRSENCTWLMDIYNHTTAKWDSYSTSNLKDWSLTNDSSSTDPFKLKVSNTLTIEASTNCACIVTTCNCFMSNMDCSGLIDYRITANQYERNGIVLSNGDRVMINNESDEKLNAQIWGYEG